MSGPHENFPPYAAINAKLTEIVNTSASIPPWYAAWRELGPQPSPEERLKVYQAVRDAGSVPDEASFYLVAWQADAITSERGETELHELEDRLRQLDTEDVDDADDSAPDKPPSEYDQLLNQYHAAWDELFARTLHEFNEPKIVEIFQNDHEQFEQLHEAGRQYFHGPLVPDWLNELVEAVASCIEVFDPMGPLGYSWHEEEDFWEIDIYPTPVELVGGAVDGAIVDPGYALDLIAIQKEFEDVKALSWNTHGDHGNEPPFVSVEGIYQGREVFLRVLSAAPEGEEPGMKFQVTR